MAQVTISGNLTMGYTKDEVAGVKTSGYGTDTSAINFNASEDLGNGLKATAQLRLDQLAESDIPNARGNGVTLGLSGGFGSLVMSSAESADYLPIDGLTSNGNGTDADRVTYTTPNISGFTASLTAQDNIGVIGETRGTSAVTTMTLAYANGPLSVDLLSASFRGAKTIGSTVVDSRTGVRASYDFGVAKVTYGMLKQDNATAADVTQTGLSVSAPLGAISLSAAMATSKTVGAAKLDGTSFGVSYALSKRTSLNYYNESFDTASAGKTKESHLLLSHSF
jgi:predicted porin